METKKTATAEDQLQINKFARLHKIYMENKLAQLNNETQNIADAEDEILMLDFEQTVPFQIGSIFVHYSQDEISNKLELSKNEKTKRISEVQTSITELEEELKSLRAILYSKFGDNIQLEMESDE